jgi:hypothetical protein
MIEKVHTTEITNIVGIIDDVVSDVRSEYDPTAGEKPYYEHGHPLEIINTLKEKSSSGTLKFKKFPLIALLEDIETENGRGVIKTNAKLNILIITDTSRDYKADDRYDNSFDLVLTPIYNLFVKYLKRKRGIHVDRRTISNSTIYHLYWGKKGLYGNEGNIFDDHIDAIEIKNLDLKLYR